MGANDILGEWKSFMTTGLSGDPRPYDRMTLTFSPGGSAKMHARTLFGRNRSFSWEYVPYGPLGSDYYIIRDLGGPGAIGTAAIEEDGTILATIEDGMVTAYKRQ